MINKIISFFITLFCGTKIIEDKRIKKINSIKFIKFFLIGLWNIIVIVSLIGVITFVSISCIMVWFLALTFIIHTSPNYDITYLSFLITLIIRLFIFEVIVLIIYYILVPVIKSIKRKSKQ